MRNVDVEENSDDDDDDESGDADGVPLDPDNEDDVREDNDVDDEYDNDGENSGSNLLFRWELVVVAEMALRLEAAATDHAASSAKAPTAPPNEPIIVFVVFLSFCLSPLLQMMTKKEKK